MNRKNLIPLVGIAFAVAVISTWIFYGLVAGRFERAASATAQTVVVAAHPLEPGATIAAADLHSITWSGADVPAGTFALTSQLVGGRLVSAVGDNEPITKATVELPEDNGAGGNVPLGMRALSLRAGDSQGLMALMGRGSLVDIQAVSTARDGTVSVHTILERIEVLNLQRPGEGGLAKNEPAVVTVLIAHADADRLAFADSAGKIRLALRNPAEEGAGDSKVPAGTPVAANIGPNSAVATGGAGSNPQVKVVTPEQRIPIEVSLLAASSAGESGIRAGEAPALPMKGHWNGITNGGVALVDGEMLGFRVRVALRSVRFQEGKYEAIVEPEIYWPGATSTEARRLSQRITWKPNDKVVVRGLSTPDGNPAVIVIAATSGGAGHER